MANQFPKKLALPNMNILQEMHSITVGFPTELRIRICKECNWSVPTFYRKMRYHEKTESGNSPNLKGAISNAEKEKIIQIFDELYPGIGLHMNKFRSSGKK